MKGSDLNDKQRSSANKAAVAWLILYALISGFQIFFVGSDLRFPVLTMMLICISHYLVFAFVNSWNMGGFVYSKGGRYPGLRVLLLMFGVSTQLLILAFLFV